MRKLALLLFLSSQLLAQPARIDFIHIPKCGGGTVSELLYEQFPGASRYPFRALHYTEGIEIIMRRMDICPSLQAAILNRFPEINESLATLHAPYWFFQYKDSNFASSFKFTCLRDPIERVRSEFRFRKKWHKHRQISYDEIPCNSLCYYLCSDPSLTGEELVHDCLRNLQQLDHLIFMDDYERGVVELFRKLGKEIGAIPKHNATEDEPIPIEILDNIIERNRWDIELYRLAKSQFGRGS